jgi:zinc transport system ATP-binding protein
MHADSPLVVENLSVKRSKKVVLDNISLTIDCGEFVGLVGPNGGGKTTLLLTILGLLKPSGGNIQLFGTGSSSPSSLRKMGWVSQHASNIPKNIKITVRELVQLGTLTSNNMFWRISDEQNIRVEKAIERVGLQNVSDTMISKLSGGQRQRAIIARTLASEAEFILLDEPLVGVDRESRNSLLKFLDNLCHRYQKTILMVSHDITAIQQTSHRMIFLEQEIQFDGSASNFPGLAELANLRGFEPVHSTDISENKIYQLEEMGDK